MRAARIRESWFWNLFLVPGGLWLALLFVAPVSLLLLISTGYTDDLGRTVFLESFDLSSYADAFNPTFLPPLLRSLGFAAATALLCLVIGYPVAYYIARDGGRYKNALIAALVLPFFVNYLVRTYAWIALLSDDGIVNSAVTGIGLRDEPIQMINTPFAVIGGLVYGYLIFMILPVYASIERLDRSVIEAGKDLFGTPFRTFWHVTLPQTRQGILAGMVLVFLPAVGDFVSAQLLGGQETFMIGNLIQDEFQTNGNWPFGAALTVVMMLFLSVWMFLYLRSAARDARAAI